MGSQGPTKRVRATAVIARDGKVLLVRDRGKHRFSLPGGGLKKGEPTLSAAARELYEELGLRATSIERLRECDFRGKASKHKVCLVTEFDGHPHIQGHELSEFRWWDTKDNVPVFAHVRFILSRLDELGRLGKH